MNFIRSPSVNRTVWKSDFVAYPTVIWLRRDVGVQTQPALLGVNRSIARIPFFTSVDAPRLTTILHFAILSHRFEFVAFPPLPLAVMLEECGASHRRIRRSAPIAQLVEQVTLNH